MPPMKTKVIHKYDHESEINRARVKPDDCTFIAARTDEGPVCIYQDNKNYPIMMMDGNLSGGFALQWSKAGILTGDFTGQIYFYPDETNKFALKID